MFIRPCEGWMTSPFGMRNHPIKEKRTFHKGVDLAKTGKVPVIAAAAGKVSRVANDGQIGQYGNVVFITHTLNGKVYDTVYAHLDSYSVKVGQSVKQGQQIGLMGNTGGSTGQHLHFELHVGRWTTGQPNAVDPAIYIDVYNIAEKGVRGPGIKELQAKLNKVGFNLTTDGIFGSGMEKAAKEFQGKFGLTVDGVLGNASLKALDNAIAELNKPKKEVKQVIKLTAGQQKAKDNLVKHGLMAKNYEFTDGVTLTLATMLSPFIDNVEKDKLFDPSTDELHNAVIDYIKEATNDGTLEDAKWLDKAQAGTLTDQDVLALHILIEQKRKK